MISQISQPFFFCVQILAGSYLSVVGAFIGLSRRARMSLFGTMLIIWSLLRDMVLGRFHNMFPTKSSQMYPTLILAVVCSFLSIKKDVRKLVHSPRARRVKLSWKVDGIIGGVCNCGIAKFGGVLFWNQKQTISPPLEKGKKNIRDIFLEQGPATTFDCLLSFSVLKQHYSTLLLNCWLGNQLFNHFYTCGIF